MAARVQPSWIVLSSVDGSVFSRSMDELAALAANLPTAPDGAGASRSLAAGMGADLLADDPVTAAADLAKDLPAPPRTTSP